MPGAGSLVAVDDPHSDGRCRQTDVIEGSPQQLLRLVGARALRDEEQFHIHTDIMARRVKPGAAADSPGRTTPR